MATRTAFKPPVAYLRRGSSTAQGTFGVLTFGALRVYSVELPWRENLVRKSCIPTGTYSVLPHVSPSKGHCLALPNVPGREAILIHSANFAGDSDAGYYTQLQGCIAPAELIGELETPAKRMQFAGLSSRPALRVLMLWADAKPFILQIT